MPYINELELQEIMDLIQYFNSGNVLDAITLGDIPIIDGHGVTVGFIGQEEETYVLKVKE